MATWDYRPALAARLERFRANPDVVPHGKLSTYMNYRCRCAPCREANRVKSAKEFLLDKQQEQLWQEIAKGVKKTYE